MKTEIELETHELTIIRVQRSQTITAFCRKCEQEVLHLTIARTAAVLQISEKEVFHLSEKEKVHSLETTAGVLLVCGNSISVLSNKNNEGEK